MLIETRYKYIDGLYSVGKEEKMRKIKGKAKFYKALGKVLVVGAIAGLTMGMHMVTVICNGTEGIGGEICIPIIAIVLYIAYKGHKRDRQLRSWKNNWFKTHEVSDEWLDR